MSLFFITGLPRSRTAWFSAFMTASGYPCLHEGMNNCTTNKEYKEKIKDISDSNTGLVFIDNPYPERPLLVIHRKGRFSDTAELEGALSGMDGMHVNFYELDSIMGEVFKYLTGKDINMDIYNTFRDLNITTKAVMNKDAAMELINETI